MIYMKKHMELHKVTEEKDFKPVKIIYLDIKNQVMEVPRIGFNSKTQAPSKNGLSLQR